MASIKLHGNEYDYNKFYSQSQKDNSFIDNDRKSRKSANDSLMYDDANMRHAKQSVFSQEDLFREENPAFHTEPNIFGPIDLVSNISLAEFSSSRPGFNSNLVSPKPPSVGGKVMDREAFMPSGLNQKSSPLHKVKAGLEVVTPQPRELQLSGSLNIKELGSGSDSAKKKFVNQYCHSNDALSPTGYETLTNSGGENLKTVPSIITGASRSGIFADVVINPKANVEEKVASKVLGSPQDSSQTKSQNHFVKQAANIFDSRASGVSSPNVPDMDDRLSYDGFLEREFNISFKREPDSVNGTAQKSDVRLSELSGIRSDNPISLRSGLGLKGTVTGITSETLLRLEQKYCKTKRPDQKDSITISHSRNDSVGKKLKETLVNLKCKGSINQPFRKKTDFIYLKANKGSEKGSRSSSLHKSGIKKDTSKGKNVQKIQKSSILNALNSMILRSRKGSFGQINSREASVRSKKSASNNSKTTFNEKNSANGSKILQLMHKNSGNRQGTRSSSQKSGKRKNLLDFQNRVQEFSISKNEAKQSLQTAQETNIMLATKKITSSSTKRLFEKIFSKDGLNQGRSIEQHRASDHTDIVYPSKDLETRSHHCKTQAQTTGTDGRRNIELDNLITKMYQANQHRSEKCLEKLPDKSQASHDSNLHSKEPSIFTSKRSLVLENMHMTRSLEKSAVNSKKGRVIGLDSKNLPEISINEIQKLSLMSSRTNPEIGFGLLNLSDVHSNPAKSSRNQFLKAKEQPTSARTEASKKLGRREEEFLLAERSELTFHRKVLFENGKAKNENVKSGLLKEIAAHDPLPRSATESGLPSATGFQKNQSSKVAKDFETSSKNSLSPIRGNNRQKIEVGRLLNDKNGAEETSQAQKRAAPKREVTPAPVHGQKSIPSKLKMLNDLIASYEGRYKDTNQL